MNISLTMETLIERFASWANTRHDVRALAILGSRARVDQPADEWSDLDLLVFAVDPRLYLDDADWLLAIAPPRLTFLEPTAVGGQLERRVLFDNALDVDVALFPANALEQFSRSGLPDPVAHVLQRGVRILLDRDRQLTALLTNLPPLPSQRHKPSAQDLDQVINDFLYHSVWGAKKLYRGELWMAKSCCDNTLKRLLLQMIEWHTQAAHGWQFDTWHNGRFLDQWAAPEIRAALPQTFAAYVSQDVQRALLATIDLFAQVAVPVTAALQTTYPHAAHEYVRTWIDEHERFV